LTLDPAKKPKTLDIIHQDGKAKGLKQYMIYKLDDEIRYLLDTGEKTAATHNNYPYMHSASAQEVR
jgi:uncharacterized protein (TIGR03067 family)